MKTNKRKGACGQLVLFQDITSIKCTLITITNSDEMAVNFPPGILSIDLLYRSHRNKAIWFCWLFLFSSAKIYGLIIGFVTSSYAGDA